MKFFLNTSFWLRYCCVHVDKRESVEIMSAEKLKPSKLRNCSGDTFLCSHTLEMLFKIVSHDSGAQNPGERAEPALYSI